MKSDQIDGLLRGATAYHRLAEGSALGQGEVPFYFGSDGRAAARMPNGVVRTGAWRIGDDSYYLDWDDGLQNSRTFLEKAISSIVARNADTGSVRSSIVRIVPGDAEGLLETAVR